MDPPDELGPQGGMDRAVLGDPGLARERRRADPHVKVALTPRRRPGMARMRGRVIHNQDLRRAEGIR